MVCEAQSGQGTRLQNTILGSRNIHRQQFTADTIHRRYNSSPSNSPPRQFTADTIHPRAIHRRYNSSPQYKITRFLISKVFPELMSEFI